MPDSQIALLYDPIVLEHRPTRGHPERPERVSSIVTTLQQSDLWDRVTHLPVRPATKEELLRVHTAAHIAHVEKVCASGGGYLDAGDTVASPGSWDAALAAAGAAIGAVDAVMGSSPGAMPIALDGHADPRADSSPLGKGSGVPGDFDASFAIVRPPGHHAIASEAMGFCIFNNVAVAAAHAIAVHGLSRVLLVDFDVHHGNGTQDIFYNDPRVLFFSSHQSPAYPGTGAVDEIGEGKGMTYTVNVPVPPGVGDEGYAVIFDTILRPVADRYRPELVLVSAGYDAHWRNSAYVQGIDERVTTQGFFQMTQRLQSIANDHCAGRLAAVLEGGYDLEALSDGVAATLRAWLGDSEIDDTIGPSPRGIAAGSALDDRLARVRSVHGL